MIRVIDYVAWRQPEIMPVLRRWVMRMLSFAEWRRIMEEPPLPGRAGWLEEDDEAAAN